MNLNLVLDYCFSCIRANKEKNTINRKNILSIDEGNEYIYQKIQEGKPFAVSRLGANESMNTALTIAFGKTRKKTFESLCLNAGFFPNDQSLQKRYANLMTQCIKDIDLFATYHVKGENFLLKNYSSLDSSICHNRGIEPWYSSSSPWTRALIGKKVLVIHPYEDSIISQYNRREMIFPNTDILPVFQLKTLKAVQSIGGGNDQFKDWFSALDFMLNEALKIDFDVAIIGCGAYGLPLAAKLKEKGKQAIHLGGCTQILFGIKGKRWDGHPVISKLYNDYWTRPNESEKPKDFSKVENGCYW